MIYIYIYIYHKLDIHSFSLFKIAIFKKKKSCILEEIREEKEKKKKDIRDTSKLQLQHL